MGGIYGIVCIFIYAITRISASAINNEQESKQFSSDFGVFVSSNPIGREVFFAAAMIGPSTAITEAAFFIQDSERLYNIYHQSKYVIKVPIKDKSGLYRISGISHISVDPHYNWPDTYTVNTVYGAHNWTIWPEELRNVALVHLNTPLPEFIHPVPLALDSLQVEEMTKPGSELFVAGPSRYSTTDFVSLKLVVNNQTYCKGFWKERVKSDRFVERVCASPAPGQSSTCVQSAFGVFAKTDAGGYVAVGNVNDYFSSDGRGTCTTNSTYIVQTFQNQTLNWVSASLECGSYKFTCASGKCIDLPLMCNGERDCEDGSDENEKFCTALNTCDPPTVAMFKCGRIGLGCVKMDKVCDGRKDCPNGFDEDGCPLKYVTILVVSLILSVVIAIVSIYYWRKYRILAQSRLTNSEAKMVVEDVNCQLALHDLEIDKSNCIGSGHFAQVYRGTVNNVAVAVKVPKPDCSKYEFLEFVAELKILCSVNHPTGHPNVVELVGACIDDVKDLKITIVLKYYANGSLDKYLEVHKQQLRNEVSQLVKWTGEIASGMKFLHSKNVLHLDLAARNILLTQNLNLKIGDFGSSRSLRSCQPEYQLPVNAYAKFAFRWLPPERLNPATALILTYTSDIWSYGVLVWEIFTLGDSPWPDSDPMELFDAMIPCGNRLYRPDLVPDDIFDNVIQPCWRQNPEDRPTFEQLCINLGIEQNDVDESVDEQRHSNNDNELEIATYENMNVRVTAIGSYVDVYFSGRKDSFANSEE